MALGVSFPRAFRQLVSEHDGAEPDQREIDIEGERGKVFAVLLGLGDDSSNGMMWTHAILRDRLPEKVIPFAEDPGGSVFCFDFRSGSDNPPVVYWPHDVRPIVLIPVAGNFELMLAKLHPPTD
jgi:cell wall assembly regulator SMI1